MRIGIQRTTIASFDGWRWLRRRTSTLMKRVIGLADMREIQIPGMTGALDLVMVIQG